jgi:hypothetical protein
MNILEEYVKYYLMSSYGYDELTKYKKATAQESISIEAIRDVFIPLPPLAEQKRIVAKIEELLPKVEEYGNIVMTIDSLQMAWEPRLVLIQLLNEKGDVVRQQSIGGPEKVTFDHLKGGKYALRAVHDQDSNGTWTAGDYWKRRQPEEVVYFEKVLELRENWDMEEHWTLRPGATAMPQMGSEAKDEKKQ